MTVAGPGGWFEETDTDSRAAARFVAPEEFETTARPTMPSPESGRSTIRSGAELEGVRTRFGPQPETAPAASMATRMAIGCALFIRARREAPASYRGHRRLPPAFQGEWSRAQASQSVP